MLFNKFKQWSQYSLSQPGLCIVSPVLLFQLLINKVAASQINPKLLHFVKGQGGNLLEVASTLD